MSGPLCRFCDARLGEPLVDLGLQPLANAYLRRGDETSEKRFPLVVRTCPQCLLVQTDHSMASGEIFTADYAYFSSYSTAWVEHAQRYCQAMIERFALSPASRVIEVASNDGYLLQHFLARGVRVLGVEPTASTAAAATRKGIPTEQAFFGKALATRLRHEFGAADLMVANNVLAHVPDLRDFVAGFACLLADGGVVTFEFPHLLRLIERVQFDTIYHEHYSYLSLAAVERILATAGLRAFDVEALPTHGGSLRLFACHAEAGFSATGALAEVRHEERVTGLDRADGPAYHDFAARVEAVRRSFRSFLAGTVAKGHSVAAYGAAAKGNTFLNYCGVTPGEIVAVADVSHAKQGRLLPGTHIPIITPDELRRLEPDYVVILPWNLADEIVASLADLRALGTKFVIALPETRVLA